MSDQDVRAESIWNDLYAACLDKIKDYQDDLLVHDKEWILANPGVPFIHATRNSGTHLIALRRLSDYPPEGVHVPYVFGQADRWKMMRDAKEWLSAVSRTWHDGDIKQYLYYEGSQLWPTTLKEATRIAEDYIKLVTRVWQEPALNGLATLTPTTIHVAHRYGKVGILVDGHETVWIQGTEEQAILLSVLLEADGHSAIYGGV